jgi:predicted alpha/beta-hydrolase family hydrolase
MKIESFKIDISESIGSVSAEVLEPSDMDTLLVLAHGAGANMHHRFMKALAKALAENGIGTLRFNFAYMEKGKGRPDPPAIAEKTVEQVILKAKELFPETNLIAGGKSFGGRMTSNRVSKAAITSLKGLVFFGFPLHPAGKPSTDRATHLKQVAIPMLFLQGTRDALAELDLIKQTTKALKPAQLILFEGADHSFAVGKKDIIPDLVAATRQWVDEINRP